METLGQRLLRLRRVQALSQYELAERSGISKNTILRIENDHLNRHPNMATVRKLAKALAVDPGWLLLGDESGKVLAAA